jgi:hypothetical protein
MRVNQQDTSVSSEATETERAGSMIAIGMVRRQSATSSLHVITDAGMAAGSAPVGYKHRLGRCGIAESKCWQISRYYSGPISDHFDGERFFDPNGTPTGSRRNLLRWFIGRHWRGGKAKWPLRARNFVRLQCSFGYDQGVVQRSS